MNTKKLRAKMVERGIKEADLAVKLGLSRNTVSRKFVGKSHFDILQIEKICSILEIIDPNEKADIFLS